MRELHCRVRRGSRVSVRLMLELSDVSDGSMAIMIMRAREDFPLNNVRSQEAKVNLGHLLVGQELRKMPEVMQVLANFEREVRTFRTMYQNQTVDTVVTALISPENVPPSVEMAFSLARLRATWSKTSPVLYRHIVACAHRMLNQHPELVT